MTQVCPPIVTVGESKSDPLMVIVVPPVVGPVAGVIPLITGVGVTSMIAKLAVQTELEVMPLRVAGLAVDELSVPAVQLQLVNS